MFDQVVAGAVEHLEPDDPFRRSAVRQRRAYWFLGKFSRLGRKSRRGNTPQLKLPTRTRDRQLDIA